MGKHSLGTRRQGRSRGGRLSGIAFFGAAALLVFDAAATSYATPYWIAWEGDDWPENQGWEHVAFNYFGGPLAVRSLHDGWITIDSTASTGIGDACHIERDALDPESGQEFIMEWRLQVDEASGVGLDPSVVIRSDDGYGVTFRYGLDSMALPLEGYQSYALEPGVPHTFQMRTGDMRRYDLFLDGAHLRTGSFAQVVTQSRVAWGDDGIGSASRTSWDYFRFGVVPEPGAVEAVLALLLTRGAAWPRWKHLQKVW